MTQETRSDGADRWNLLSIGAVRGDLRWEVTLGTTRDLAPWPLWLDTGTPNLGGPLVTASGLVFIGATTDFFLRAFDVETGAELWKARLPTAAHAMSISSGSSATSR